MKQYYYNCFLLTILTFFIAGENIFVKIYQKEKTIAPGESGTLLIKITPLDENILINLEPPIELNLEKNAPIILKNSNITEKLKENNPSKYLDTSSPLEVEFKLKKNIKPGKTKMKGKITFFYCHKIEGWCMMKEDSVEFTINVSKKN